MKFINFYSLFRILIKLKSVYLFVLSVTMSVPLSNCYSKSRKCTQILMQLVNLIKNLLEVFGIVKKLCKFSISFTEFHYIMVYEENRVKNILMTSRYSKYIETDVNH